MRREAHLASTVVTQSAKGRGGVIGLEATLNSVREGRIQTLLIRDGYRAPGTSLHQLRIYFRSSRWRPVHSVGAKPNRSRMQSSWPCAMSCNQAGR